MEIVVVEAMRQSGLLIDEMNDDSRR